jgi:CDP-paratose 2-epimerase
MESSMRETCESLGAQEDEERSRPVLITGGAGFIGCNLAQRLLCEGRRVVLYDSLARGGVQANARWLTQQHGTRVALVVGDTRDGSLLRELVSQASRVYHFAAQVAVTTSLDDPIEDFDVNLRGTLNVLEALRALDRPPPVLFTSTNKVYGNLSDMELEERDSRYAPRSLALKDGVGELRPLDFHSPYGCSKGAADQYVLDYARSFGLRATVFRMSCIYGPRQFGTEDQGWVAHFLLRAMSGEPITIYGNGKQVRDVLFVSDLVEAMMRAAAHTDQVAGKAFNIGGGPEHTISLLELIDLIGELDGQRPSVRFDNVRVGDQPYYVSDTRRFSELTGWTPKVGVREGVERLRRWLTSGAMDHARVANANVASAQHAAL